MKVVFPLEGESAESLYKIYREGFGGCFPLGVNQFWHGGIHLQGNRPVIAIASGKLVAYRITKKYLTLEMDAEKYHYSNSFVLLEHEYSSPKGNKLKFYSLYMHLLPLDEYNDLPVPSLFKQIRYKVGNQANDLAPNGLNLYSSADRSKIEIVAPKGSLLKFDSNLTAEELAVTHWAQGSSTHHKVIYRDPTGAEHRDCFAATGDGRTRTVVENELCEVTTEEDALLPSQAAIFKGIRVRTGPNDTILRVLPKGVAILARNTGKKDWGYVVYPNDVEEGDYLYLYRQHADKLDNGAVYLKELTQESTTSAETYDEVAVLDTTIQAGELVGHPGLYAGPVQGMPANQPMVHIEVFSDSDVEQFLENPMGDGQGRESILKIAQEAGLKEQEKRYNESELEKAAYLIPSGAKVEMLEAGGMHSEYAQVKPQSVAKQVKRDWLGEFKNNTYPMSSSNAAALDSLKAAFDGYPLKSSDSFGYVERASDEDRVVRFDLPSEPVWVKKGLLKITGDKTAESTATIPDLYLQHPDALKFEKDAPAQVPEDIYLDMGTAETAQDDGSNKWYKVSTTDDQGRAVEGWIQDGSSHLTKLSAYDWPGFAVAKESGEQNRDGFCDYRDLTPFFRTIFEKIDSSGDKELSHGEIQAAIKDPRLGPKLAKTVCQHPSEWHAEDDLGKWKRLEQIVSDEGRREKIKEQIKKLIWWKAAQAQNSAFTASPSVYHFHPIEFVLQMQELNKDPVWMKIAKAEAELGVAEIAGHKHNPRIVEYHSITSYKAADDETLWCSSFVNWVMKQAGYTPTRSAGALSWKHWGKPLSEPAYASIGVIAWGQGKGHVGFVVGKQGSKILLLGGNQSDQVNVEKFGRDRFVAFVVPEDYVVDTYELKEYEGDFSEASLEGTR